MDWAVLRFERYSPFFFASTCIEESCAYICTRLEKRWPVRLGVRTADFHSVNRGSIPLRATKEKTASRRRSFYLVTSD